MEITLVSSCMRFCDRSRTSPCNPQLIAPPALSLPAFRLYLLLRVLLSTYLTHNMTLSTKTFTREPHAFEDADRFEQTRKRRRTDTTSQEQDSKTTGSVRMDILAETTTYTPRPTALLPSKHTQLSGTAGGLYPLPEQPPSHSNTEDSTVSGNAAKPQLTVVSKSGHKTLIQLDESARQVTCHDTQIGEGQSAAVGNTVQLHLIVTVHPGNKVIARTSQTKMVSIYALYHLEAL